MPPLFLVMICDMEERSLRQEGKLIAKETSCAGAPRWGAGCQAHEGPVFDRAEAKTAAALFLVDYWQVP